MNQSQDEKPYDLKQRTLEFALRVVRLVKALPRGKIGTVMGSQVLRSATSVGAQYREAVRSRSTAEFISKLESTLQELEETNYWFELIAGAELIPASRLESLQREAHELSAIFTATVIRVKANRDAPASTDS